jgi:hypothetical protein
MLDTLISSGRIADIALVVLVLEVVGLGILRSRLRRGPSIAAMLWNAAAGASLILALRAALTGAGTAYVALFLGAALVAHVGDAAMRWRRSDREMGEH